ncbi:MAG: hypothetical protein ABR604_03145 [Jatrophihabitantaceae bacterium]
MTESADDTIARLERELANAKIAALQQELDQVRAASGAATGGTAGPWTPHLVPLGKPATPPAARLAPVPRRVPVGFRLVVLPWSWWTVFALFMMAVAPIAIWALLPIAGAVAAGATFLAIALLRARRYRLQIALLRWGEVATVRTAGKLSVGTYYSGTTYSNVRLAQAHGWQVERRWYSGPSTTTKIDYELGGTPGQLTLRGLPYDDGVILAHSKKPGRALCVSSFPYDLDRDPDGNWVGKVPLRVSLGALAMTVVLAGWTGGLTALFLAAARSR